MQPGPARARPHPSVRRRTRRRIPVRAPRAPRRARSRSCGPPDRRASPTRGTRCRRTRGRAGSFEERSRDGVCRVGPARYGGSMAIDVRPATTGDLAAGRALLGHRHDQPGGAPTRAMLVAEDRGEFAVGTADVLVVPNLTHDGAPWALVENVVVDPQWRRRGIGKALLKHAVRVADDAGCFKLQLTSSNHRDEAHRFYERLGFTATSTGFRWALRERERGGAA